MQKKINEIFYSIQGEGHWTGTPMVFIRMSGCNLKCHFCDTEHEAYTEMSDDEILASISKYPSPYVCITGGEPALQLDQDLVDLLVKDGRRVHIETNGTHSLPDNITWVTVSPKNKKVVLEKANEVKMVYEGQDVSKWLDFNAEMFYLQPCSCTNTNEVIDYIKEHPQWKISVQIHKLLNVQ